MKTLKILFLCTGNSCRSQMAEGWCKRLAGDLPAFLKIEASSAGLEAHGLNPAAVAAMTDCGVDISGQQSRLVTEAMLLSADLVITVCSHADSHCPAGLSAEKKIHLPFDDPAQATGSEEEVREAFARVCQEIKQAVSTLLQNLTLQSLEQLEGSVFHQSDVEISVRERAYNGFIPVDVMELRHRLFNGGWSDTLRRELAVRPPAVGVLLYDPDRQKLVMLKQFRTGAIGTKQSPWMLEIVAGLADDGESPSEVAKREALEEANCKIRDVFPIFEYFNSPGWCDENISLFYALVDSDAIQGIHGLDEEHEDILVVTVTLEKAAQLLESGEINNAMSLIAIQWLLLNKSRLHKD